VPHNHLLDDLDDDMPRSTRKKPRSSRGPLHDILTRGLPDLVDKTSIPPVCDLHKLAVVLKMSPQGVYKWFQPGRNNAIPFRRVTKIVALSEKQKSGGKAFKPLTLQDFSAYACD
jgi:hypothetical protein